MEGREGKGEKGEERRGRGVPCEKSAR